MMMQLTQAQWQRYIDNQCSAAERKEIYEYLQGLEEDELAALLSSFPVQAARMPAFLAKSLDEKLQVATGVDLSGRPRPGYRTMARRWVAAASIVLIAALSLYLLRPSSSSRSRAPQLAAHRAVVNATSQVKLATLPDGSRVWLTPGAVLDIAGHFNTADRSVTLTGQGYFEVMHDPSRPFIVHAGGLVTRVLGTHFNIEAYPDEAQTIVSLTQGKVSVQSQQAADRLVYLHPGHKLVYGKKDGEFEQQAIAPEYEQSWRNGALVFDNLPVADVFNRIGQRFGKKIIADPRRFAGKRYSAVYPAPDLPVILQNMAFVQGFHFLQRGDSILIR